MIGSRGEACRCTRQLRRATRAVPASAHLAVRIRRVPRPSKALLPPLWAPAWQLHAHGLWDVAVAAGHLRLSRVAAACPGLQGLDRVPRRIRQGS